jgi:hypothetical protein
MLMFPDPTSLSPPMPAAFRDLRRARRALEAAAPGQYGHAAPGLQAVHRVATAQGRVPRRAGILNACDAAQGRLMSLSHPRSEP